MKANWTTKNGKKIELTVIHENGFRKSTTISIDGNAQSGSIEKANGIWAVAVKVNGQNGYITLPAGVMAQIEKDGKQPVIMSAADVAEDEKTTRDFLFAREMESKYSDL